jgi:hypothetical protein
MNLLKTMLVIYLAALLSMATGCSIFQKGDTASQPAPAAASGGAGQSNVVASGAPVKASLGRYYDFNDIQVPNQLKLNKDKSILFKVGNFKAGLLTFSDNLEVESLINWFAETMAKDNWTLKSSFKYPKVALFFAKPGKTCVIHITEHTFSTEVEIWVAPTI